MSRWIYKCVMPSFQLRPIRKRILRIKLGVHRNSAEQTWQSGSFWISVPHRRWWIKMRGTSTTYISSVNAINHIFLRGPFKTIAHSSFFAVSIQMGVNHHHALWISIWSFDHILLPVNRLVNQARHSSSIWVISGIRCLGQGFIWFLGKIAKLACKSQITKGKEPQQFCQILVL